MKLIFYGTMGAIPTKENTSVSFAVTEGVSSLLIDTSGSPTHSLLRSGINPLDLDALVLTHTHPDHLYAFPALIQSLWLMKREKPLSIITNHETEAKARQLCEIFDLSAKKDLFPNQLSGGQQQLVGVARALISTPNLLLADEPTGNLHSEQGKEIMELLKKLNDQGMTIIQVTHSEENAAYGNRIIKLSDGWIEE